MEQRACIILPTYNEAKNIPIIIPRIFAQSEKIATHDLHVLVVDDKSPDGTEEEVRKCMETFANLHLISGEKRGLGEAYKRGMDHAIEFLDPDIIFEMDADLQHSPDLLPLFVSLTTYDFSLVIGSRFAPGGSTPNFSFRRRLLSNVGNILIRLFGGLPKIHDCTSGFRCIKAELIKKCEFGYLSTRGYSFQSSLLCELLRQGARVIEIPIVFPDRVHGESKLTFNDQVEFLVNLFKIRFRSSGAFLRFLGTGLSGLIVNMLVYILLTRAFGSALEYAAALAIEISILWNFVMRGFMDAEGRREGSKWFGDLLSYHRVMLFGAVVNFGILILLANGFGIWDILSNLIGIIAGIVVNYYVRSLRAWNEIEGRKDA